MEKEVATVSGRTAFEHNGDKGEKKEERRILSVGNLSFNEAGYLKLGSEERMRAAKGKSKDESRKPCQKSDDRHLVKSPAPILAPLLAGKSSNNFSGQTKPILSGTSFEAENSTVGPFETSHRKPYSAFDPVQSEFLAAASREKAEQDLAEYKSIMTRLPFEALQDAAMGDRLGGTNGDKRQIARSKALIKSAVIAFSDFVSEHYKAKERAAA